MLLRLFEVFFIIMWVLWLRLWVCLLFSKDNTLLPSHPISHCPKTVRAEAQDIVTNLHRPTSGLDWRAHEVWLWEWNCLFPMAAWLLEVSSLLMAFGHAELPGASWDGDGVFPERAYSHLRIYAPLSQISLGFTDQGSKDFGFRIKGVPRVSTTFHPFSPSGVWLPCSCH